MEARICDRCGAIWKDAKEEKECGVYVQKIAIKSDHGYVKLVSEDYIDT